MAAEITDKLHTSLSEYKIIVEECTGDTNIPKSVLTKANILVCTPEKWDVMTRMNNENEILENVELLIIDEVHLLNDDRGHVIENIVARQKMYNKLHQKQKRIVALSATLPNYQDVAEFLDVQEEGTFFFDKC